MDAERDLPHGQARSRGYRWARTGWLGFVTRSSGPSASRTGPDHRRHVFGRSGPGGPGAGYRRQRGGAGPGHRAGHLPGGQHDLHQPRAPTTCPAASTGSCSCRRWCTAITASLLDAGLLWPGLARRAGEKTLLLAGLLADLVSMVLLIAELAGGAPARGWPIGLLLAATACLGAGLRPGRAVAQHLGRGVPSGGGGPVGAGLNALLGLGTALAPVFVAVFDGLGFWIGLPVLAACLLAGLIAVSLRLPLRPGGARAGAVAPAGAGGGIPAGSGCFGAFAVLVRVLRDDERQLVAARHHVAGRAVGDRVARADRRSGRW